MMLMLNCRIVDIDIIFYYDVDVDLRIVDIDIMNQVKLVI